jgi:hypothetical protein
MTQVNIEKLQRKLIPNHRIEGTEKVSFNYTIEAGNKMVAAGHSTITLNTNGIFPDTEDLICQIEDRLILQLLLTYIKKMDWNP